MGRPKLDPCRARLVSIAVAVMVFSADLRRLSFTASTTTKATRRTITQAQTRSQVASRAEALQESMRSATRAIFMHTAGDCKRVSLSLELATTPVTPAPLELSIARAGELRERSFSTTPPISGTLSAAITLVQSAQRHTYHVAPGDRQQHERQKAFLKETEGVCKGGGDGRQEDERCRVHTGQRGTPSHPMLPRPALHLGCMCVWGEGVEGGKACGGWIG